MSDDTIRVLHVDDEPDFADVTALHVEREDDRFEFVTATSAADGLDRLADGGIDCVVSDYDMPGQDGLEFLEAVRADHPDLPFILFTGKGNEEVASEAISAGVTDYLQKDTGTSQYAVLANRIRNSVDKYRTQTQLADREKRLTLFFEQSPLGVIEWDEDFDLVRMNDAATEILGYTEDELVDEPWQRIVPESERDAVGDIISNLLENEGGYHSVNRNVRKDGEEIVCEWHNRVVTDSDGSVVAVFSQFQDITDRTEQARELEEAEAMYRTLAEEFPAGGVHFFDEDLRYQYVAGGGFDPIETSPEDLMGNTIYEVEPYSEDVVETLEPLMEATLAGNEERLEIEYEGRVYELRSVPVRDEDGEVTSGFFVARDITDQHEQQQALQRKNERLENFASIVSHDLRNPLRVATSRIELASEECASDHLDAASDAIERSQALIDDLLTLARQGETIGSPVAVDFEALVEECWGTVATEGARLALDADETTVRADRGRLKQLLENLVRNAVEHGGTTTESGAGWDGRDDEPTAVTVTVGVMDGGFYVADDGPGVPAAERDSVFEAGYTKSRDGTGFGLAIVREIANAHGWEISVTESEQGGARFEITGVEMD